MVCSGCKDECRKLREAALRKKQAEEEADRQKKEVRRQKVAQERIERENFYEWRTASADEVDSTPHSAEFRAVFANYELHEILFRWREVPGKCRGNSYLSKVGSGPTETTKRRTTMLGTFRNSTGSSKATGKPLLPSENNWPVEDLLDSAFKRRSRPFQALLLKLKPDQIWKPGGYDEVASAGDGICPCTLLVELV